MWSRVSAIVRHTADHEVLPMFRKLRPEDILAKDTPGDPDDIVTITDNAAERLLIDQLGDIVPGAVFIGEEAASADATLVGSLARPAPAWVIDPIDGTKNFARGNPNFGVMLALVQEGMTRASWIAMPALNMFIFAAAGEGTLLDDAPVDMTPRNPDRLRGSVHSRLMPAEVSVRVQQRLEGRYDALPSTGAAATEYAGILRGDKDFVIYYRLLPWDHAAGALAVTEAGGAAIHLDGRPYSPLSADQVTVFAATPKIASAILRLIS